MNLSHHIGRVFVSDMIDPTKSNASDLYNRVCETNVEDIFSTDLSVKYGGKRVLGSKAVGVIDDFGSVKIAFLTETINVHHRHAAAYLFGMNDLRARALFDGDEARAKDYMNRCAGFQLQYDPRKKYVFGIQQDSWMTNRQQGTRELRKEHEEVIILEILNSIAPRYQHRHILDGSILEKPELFLARRSA